MERSYPLNPGLSGLICYFCKYGEDWGARRPVSYQCILLSSSVQKMLKTDVIWRRISLRNRIHRDFWGRAWQWSTFPTDRLLNFDKFGRNAEQTYIQRRMAPNISRNLETEPVINRLEASGKSGKKETESKSSLEPKGAINEGTHFSSLLFSGDVNATLLELAVLSFLGSVALLRGQSLNVGGSMTFREVTYLLLLKS